MRNWMVWIFLSIDRDSFYKNIIWTGALFIDKENPYQLEKEEEGKPILKADNLSNHFSVTMPMTLFPSPFPTELYEKARGLQQLMAEVHLRVSLDYTFIKVSDWILLF